MELILHYAPISCALVPYIALTEAQADFAVHIVDFRRGGHMTPEFLRINPKHQVPVLVIDGKPLTENVAIQLWVARKFPDAGLLPVGGDEEFKAIELMAWCDSGIHPHADSEHTSRAILRCPRLRRWRKTLRRVKYYQEKFSVAEDLLGDKEWFLERFTLHHVILLLVLPAGGAV